MKDLSVKEHLKNKLKDAFFKELYELELQKISIVDKIIDYRIKNHLTQGDLAKKVGVSQQHISKIENAEFSNVVTLQKVLLAIGMTIKIEAVHLMEYKNDIVGALREAPVQAPVPTHKKRAFLSI